MVLKNPSIEFTIGINNNKGQQNIEIIAIIKFKILFLIRISVKSGPPLKIVLNAAQNPIARYKLEKSILIIK